MRAGDELLGTIFNRDHRYVIPIFQRPYVWDEEDNWVPLWHDVRKAAEAVEGETHRGDEPQEYFLGAFVTQHQNPVPRRPPSSLVIDGQQRMTTMQVFLAAARRAAQARGADGAAASLETLIANRVSPHSDHPDDAFKLTPLATDRAAFVWAMQGLAHRQPAPDPVHRIVRASRFFDDTLREWLDESDDPVERLDLLHFAIDNRIKVVSVFLEAKDDPQVIFEALNHAGVRLDAADLIKNLLFQTLARQGDQDLEAELLRDHWQALDGDTWRRTVTTGRIKRVRIDTLLAYWLSVQRGEESSAEHLFEEFKRWMRVADPRAADVIRHIRQYADTMDALQARPMIDAVAQVIDRLDSSGTATPWPLLLFLHAEPGISPEQATRGALAIDSFLMRRTICGLTSKDYNRLFASVLHTLGEGDRADAGDRLAAELAAQSAPSRYWPSDREFMLALNRSDMYTGVVRARLKALLVGIENALMRDARAEAAVPWRSGDKGLTIEHVMPRSWETSWPLPAPGDDAVLERRERVIHNLGNLTLVTQSLNSTLSNGPWQVKRPALQSNSLVRISQASVLTRPEGVQRFTEEEWTTVWDEDRIELRATWLTVIAVQVWAGPASRPTFDPMSTGPAVLPSATAPAPGPTPSLSSTPPGPAVVRRPSGAVAQHVREVFERYPADTELSVADLVAEPSSLYPTGTTVSSGAINQLVNGPSAGDLEWVPGTSPQRIRRRVAGRGTRPEDIVERTPGHPALARDFHAAMTTLYKRSQREVGYNPTAFIRMISEIGGLETAQRLVLSAAPSDGFAILWEAGRLDLTAEALVTSERYRSLFDDDVVELARERLAAHGHDV